MQRRQLLKSGAALTGVGMLAARAPAWAQAVTQRAQSNYDRVLVLVELKGGNDGLNTVVPYTDSLYYQLRESIAIRREDVIRVDSRVGLHPELADLLPLWDKGELAIVQGVGYPEPNLSHFRSIEIWDTASRSNEYLSQGWVTRAMQAGVAKRASYSAEGVVVGGADSGVLAGARSVRLNNPETFVNQAHLAIPVPTQGNAALQHILRVESDVSAAAQALRAERFNFTTAFPAGPFGTSVRAAVQVVASQRGKAGVPVLVLSLGSFDTHQNQANTHANLLRQLGAGLAALKGALVELDAWERTLVMSFSEFGRRARQNGSNGTDHGTAAPHFVTGGAVRGGLFGQPPELGRLDTSQNLVATVDFRQLYATIAKDWWGVDSSSVVRGNFQTLPFIKG